MATITFKNSNGIPLLTINTHDLTDDNLWIAIDGVDVGSLYVRDVEPAALTLGGTDEHGGWDQSHTIGLPDEYGVTIRT